MQSFCYMALNSIYKYPLLTLKFANIINLRYKKLFL